MIIMSQDKTEIINFDNVNTLRATKTGFIVSYENTYKPEDDCSNILGKYETEERAKEVLITIMKWYDKLRTDIVEAIAYSCGMKEYYYFEMPKE